MLHTEGKARKTLSSAVSYNPFLAGEWERHCHFSSSLQADTSLPRAMRRGSRVTEMQKFLWHLCKPLSSSHVVDISQQEQLCGSLDQPVFALFLQVFASAFLGWALWLGRVSHLQQEAGTVELVCHWCPEPSWLSCGSWKGLAHTHRQIPAPPLRYCSAPLIRFLPAQDPQLVVGSPELVMQPLPRADKCHVVLKNGWMCAIGSFWGCKTSSVHIFLLKTEEILYWNVNMMQLVTCHSSASCCNVSIAWVTCPSSLFLC